MQIISPVREKFFPNRENSSAQSAVEPLRATAGMPGDAPMARLYDLMRAREYYIILGIDETGKNGVISWRNRAVEHYVEHSWNTAQRNDK